MIVMVMANDNPTVYAADVLRNVKCRGENGKSITVVRRTPSGDNDLCRGTIPSSDLQPSDALHITPKLTGSDDPCDKRPGTN
jgi:hypothetical protein